MTALRLIGGNLVETALRLIEPRHIGEHQLIPCGALPVILVDLPGAPSTRRDLDLCIRKQRLDQR